DTICSGNAPMVINNSIGYDNFSWSVDGQFISNDSQPTLPVQSTGQHIITLTGTVDGVTEEISQTFFVDQYQEVPVLSLVEPLCWAGVTAHILATTTGPTLGYE